MPSLEEGGGWVQRIRQCRHLAALGAAGAESNLIQCRQSELRNILMDLQRLGTVFNGRPNQSKVTLV